jgi:hypothetical protein
MFQKSSSPVRRKSPATGADNEKFETTLSRVASAPNKFNAAVTKFKGKNASQFSSNKNSEVAIRVKSEQNNTFEKAFYASVVVLTTVALALLLFKQYQKYQE